MQDLSEFLALVQGVPIVTDPDDVAAPIKRGRPGKDHGAVIGKAESQRRIRSEKKEQRLENIAILDFETDPFDNANNDEIHPFVAVLYTEQFEPTIIWEEDHEAFIEKVIAAILALPDAFTIYAHNGGKFDYMFLLYKLRGFVSFKGRGIMSANIGPHILRDSFHIIPEKLANWQKDTFDYKKLHKSVRHNFRDEIIRYCVNDCKYLLDIVKDFLRRFGFRISIGQAAMYEMKRHYNVKRLAERSDEYLRQYFFGGRVECLQGAGHWKGDFKLFDVNSMYPYVMANFQHPIGNDFLRRPGQPNAKTIFIELECRNRGALVRRGQDGETTAREKSGRFLTTIWEYETALKYDLIDRVRIIDCLDFEERSDFSKFIEPIYAERMQTKDLLRTLKKDSYEYNEAKKNDIFLKLIMNNAYGKFAQNPRRYKQTFLTDHGLRPNEESETWGMFPVFESPLYDIWERPNPSIRFNNVATAASITGAARAQLMEAIQLADDPIYCDTDSVICRNLEGVPIDKIKLGAWDLESEFAEVIIAGKKLYSCKMAGKTFGQTDFLKVRSKGANLLPLLPQDKEPQIIAKQHLAWAQMLAMLEGKSFTVAQTGMTLTKDGRQFYMRRNIRATAETRKQIHA